MSGCLALVVGPSGAGKDTLLAAARRLLAGDGRFVFQRRDVTRPVDAAIEDHRRVSGAEFEARRAEGGYALSWQAHGLSYGIPAAIRDDLAAGRVVTINASRTVIAEARRAFETVAVILVTAPVDVRARRLAARGRESAEDVAARLRREVEAPLGISIPIENTGTPEAGAARLVEALRRLADG